MVDQFKEQELSNVVWAFAKLHHYKSDMFRKLLEAVSYKLPHFLPQVRALSVRFLADAGTALLLALLPWCQAHIQFPCCVTMCLLQHPWLQDAFMCHCI